jgi:hypothetical protein
MMLVQTLEPLANLVAEDPRHRHRRHLDDRREHSDLGRRGSHLERGEVAADHGDTRRGSQAFSQRRCVIGRPHVADVLPKSSTRTTNEFPCPAVSLSPWVAVVATGIPAFRATTECS